MDTDLADSTADEQNRADRRCNVSKAHIEDQHNAKLDICHSETLCDRKEDWCKDQDCRRDVHEHTDYHEDDVHQQEDHIFVRGDGHEAGGDGSRDSGVCHDKGHGRGCGDQKQDDTAGAGTVYQDFCKGFYSDAPVTDRENQAIKNADACTFGCSENTAHNTTDDDHDQKQTWDRFQSDF